MHNLMFFPQKSVMYLYPYTSGKFGPIRRQSASDSVLFSMLRKRAKANESTEPFIVENCSALLL